MGWHREPLIGFEPETTGTDPHGTRIVTGAVSEVGAGEAVGRREWPAGPGVPIPEDAVAVHGVGDERATAEGGPAAFPPRVPGASRMSRPAAACRVPVHAGAEAA
ncbi:hypothetical protein ADK41_10465 [Streptomyces caelestis]|uniref:Uncharacterized protein n=1 Tax=Streptomyces caelestis TaxID=36816 RepID=A0A0M8QTT7_9ACTN|nr:hypothetical protein ADK41_10465 [Streptomyces caelestis]